MRKICLVSSLLIFLLSFTTLRGAFAQETAPTPSPKVNYELPYPGLLPDSPLYFLRIIRDKVVSFLIADPLKKAEFNLLQADKRLNAGIFLFNKSKVSMSISTISKAENYFEESLQKVKEAKEQGMNTTELTNKLIDSSKKHLEVLKSLEKKSPQNFKSSFHQELQRVKEFEQEAREFISKR